MILHPFTKCDKVQLHLFQLEWFHKFMIYFEFGKLYSIDKRVSFDVISRQFLQVITLLSTMLVSPLHGGTHRKTQEDVQNILFSTI